MYEPVQCYTNSFQPKSPSSFTFGPSTFRVQPKAKKARQSQSNNSYLTQAAPVQSREPLGHSHQSQTVIDRNVNELGLLEYLKVGAAIITSLPIDYVEYLVVVQPNSSAPAKVNALATTQWENGKIVIKTVPGQDRLVIHEFGHAIKLMQGLVVEPTIEVNGVPVNDEQELETQADCDGQRAVALGKAAVSNLDLGTARLLQLSAPLLTPASA